MPVLRQKAFTLIEVMVALAIVAISLAIIMTAISEGLGTARDLRDRTFAIWIAQNKISELRLANSIPEVGETSGEIQFGHQDWLWEASVTESGVENLLRVDVAVSHVDSEEVVRTVTGFVGEPHPPGQSNGLWSSLGAGAQN